MVIFFLMFEKGEIVMEDAGQGQMLSVNAGLTWVVHLLLVNIG